MKDKLVTVVIPTFNRKEQVKKAIDSVLAQSYSNFELIVVDDGSSDGTQEKVSAVADDRLYYQKINRSGVSKARNIGSTLGDGKYIAFLDSDDYWHSQKLARQISFHNKNPKIKISQTQEIWIRNGKRVNPKNKHKKPSGYIFPESLHLCTITPSSVFIERELFEKEGKFDERMPACEDYDLWLRITSKHQVGLINEFLLTKLGGHQDQLSGLHPAMDRFRIYSLVKIFLSNSLTQEQKQEVKTILHKKLDILLAGIKKRKAFDKNMISYLERLYDVEIAKDEFISLAKLYLLNDRYFYSE